jgi:hypothetical protein
LNNAERLAGRLHTNDGQVVGRVGSNDLRLELALVGECDFQRASPFYNVVIREDMSLLIDDGARTGALFGHSVEEEIEIHRGGGDVDDRRANSLVDFDAVGFVLSRR